MNRTTKRIVALGTPLAAVAISGVAFAAWTATGTGSGNAKAASAKESTVSVIATPSADAAIWPGNTTAAPVHFSVDNTNPYGVTFSTFSNAKITSVSPDTCTQFSLSATSGDLASDVAVTAGSSNTGATAGILLLDHSAGDDCQGAVVTVSLDVAGTQN